jgi:hypothetical protein
MPASPEASSTKITSNGAVGGNLAMDLRHCSANHGFPNPGMMIDTSGRSLVGSRTPATSALRSGRLSSDVRIGPSRIRLGAGAPGGAKYLSKRVGLRLSAELANRADIRSEIGAVAELSILRRR